MYLMLPKLIRGDQPEDPYAPPQAHVQYHECHAPKGDLDNMEVVKLVGEIRAHKMAILGMEEEATSNKSIAFKAKVKNTHKLKMIKQDSS